MRAGRCRMISRRTVLLMLTTVTVCSSLPAWAAGGPVGMFDTDNDGTIDLMEAKKAASAVFDRLDRDKDGTLDRRGPSPGVGPEGIARPRPRHCWQMDQEEKAPGRGAPLQRPQPGQEGTPPREELGSPRGE